MFSKGVDSMSSAAKAHEGGIVMLIEKEPVTRENPRRRFTGITIYEDIDDDSEWNKFERKPGAALGRLAGPPCQPFASTGKGKMEK